MLLPLVLLLAACDPVGYNFQNCNITKQNGRVETWTNVIRIQKTSDRTYVKILEEVGKDYWAIREYITYDVISYTCWYQR
jgi:hypothetical protein